MAQPRINQHYDPKGHGSMLKKGDTLILHCQIYPYLDKDNNVQWSLGFTDKTDAELAAIENKFNTATSIEAKQDILDEFKALSISSFYNEYTTAVPDGSVISFQLECNELRNILDAIPVNITTTEASYAQAVESALNGKTKLEVTKTFVAVGKSGKPYMRAKGFEMK